MLGKPSVVSTWLPTSLAPLNRAGTDSRLADEARLRLASTMNEQQLRAWITRTDARETEEARRAGLAALRLLGDAAAAERLLAPLEGAGRHDVSLLEALVDVYAGLDRPKDLARVAGALLPLTNVESEHTRLVLLQADSLARTGDSRTALALLEPLRHASEPAVRQAARSARYEVLHRAGRLEAEVASLSDRLERAFVALEVEHNYVEAERLYSAAVRDHPDSLECAAGLREAERRRDLAERRSLYTQVLSKDPDDQATQDKLLAVLVALGDEEATHKWVDAMLRGRETEPEALVRVAQALHKAGVERDSVRYLEKAYAAEGDAVKKQQILFTLGDLYAGARQEQEARRLYTGLATEGANLEIRERAMARLASLLR
jgi:predicted Zn-dependent protease